VTEADFAGAQTVEGSTAEDNPALLRWALGVRLRRLREAAGISRTVAGGVIHLSDMTIRRLEVGRGRIGGADVGALLRLYGIDDPETRSTFLRLTQRADAAARRPTSDDLDTQRWDTYLAVEDVASVLRCYTAGVVPDLLQTAAYAHAVSAIARPASTARIQRRVELLMRRQHLLDRPDPPKLWVVIEEAVLRRPFGGLEVWRDQLAYLIRAAERDHITIQIVPDYVGGPAISAVPFTLLRFDRPDIDDVVHLHNATDAQFLYESGDLDAYRLIWDRLSVHAMPPEYTGELITALTARRPDTAQPADDTEPGTQ
jgi:hypothetical protein